MDPASFPALFVAADQSSLGGQRWFKWLTWIELALIAGGAGASTVLAMTDASDEAISTVAGSSFLLALVTRLITRARHDDVMWFDGRALAETVKSQAWRYMMAVPPFADSATADRDFVHHVRSAIRARGIRGPADGTDELASQITDHMRSVRQLATGERVRYYVRERLQDQARWYRRSSVRHRRIAAVWSRLALVAEGAAVLTAAIAVSTPLTPASQLFGLFGTLAASFAALNQVGRHQESARAYHLAYQELLAIEDLATSVATDQDLATLVQDGEGAISREHTMWMAKRAEPLQITA